VSRNTTSNKKKRRRLSPEQRSEELIEAAVAVFARLGLGRAGHAQVAEEAGCAVSTVFVYFPSRESLVDAVIAEVAGFLLEMAESVHGSGGPAPEVVRRHARAFVEGVNRRPDVARVWLDYSTAVGEDTWPRYLELQEKIVAIMRDTIERGQGEGSVAADVDADDDARLVVGSAHMLAQMKFAGRPDDQVEHFLNTLVGLTMRPPA